MSDAWPMARLGDVCQTGAGGTPLSSKKEYYEGGTIPWLVSGEVAQGEITTSTNFITDLGLENSSARIFPENTVLVAMYGATAGQVGLLRFNAATNQAVCGILPNDKFIPKFMYYLLLSKKQELIAQATGNAQPNISQIKIKNTTVPLPPLAEQQRIVAILDEAFAGLATATANAEKNLKNARELFDGYLNAAITRDSEGWAKKRLEEIVDQRCSLSYGIVQPGDEILDGLPIVRPLDLTTKFIRVDGLKRIDPSLAGAYSRTKLSGGELLLCVRGTTGLVSIASEELAGANVTRGIVPIAFDAPQMRQRFGYYALLSDSVQRQIREKTYGTALMQINIRDLRNLMIPIPSPAEQERIATNLDVLSDETLRLQEIYQRKLGALEALKETLLEKAFAGELTSPPSQAIKEAAE